MKKQKTQWKDVLDYLMTHDGISSMEAWELFHITRLSHVIFILRKRGYNIKTVMYMGVNEYGPYQYGMYVLEDKDTINL